jgi:hypothetical protein
MKKFLSLLALAVLTFVMLRCSGDEDKSNVYVSFVLDGSRVAFNKGIIRDFDDFVQGEAFDNPDTVYFSFSPELLEKGASYPIVDGDGAIYIGYVEEGNYVSITDGTTTVMEVSDSHIEITFSGQAEASEDKAVHQITNGIIRASWKNEE